MVGFIIILVGIVVLAVPCVALVLALWCSVRLTNQETQERRLRNAIFDLETSLGKVEKRLKELETTQNFSTPLSPTRPIFPQPVAPQPTVSQPPVPVFTEEPSDLIQQSAKEKAEKLVQTFHTKPQPPEIIPQYRPRLSKLRKMFSKSKAALKARRKLAFERLPLLYFLGDQVADVRKEDTKIEPKIELQDVPFVAQIVQQSAEHLSQQQEVHELKSETKVEPKTIEKIEKTVVEKEHAKKLAASTAYDLDEDHDLKPSFFTGEQSQLNYLELQIGRKVLGWVASLAMILTAVFLINYTARHFTLLPIYRVLGLFAFGIAMLGVGFRYYLIGWKRFSRMLTSTGILILFLTGYAAYGYYHLLSSAPAFVLMSVIVIGAFLLAYAYRSVLIGVHAIVGGLVVPLLIESSPDAYPQFFVYLFLLNLGTVLLLNTLNRLPIGLLAMLGTQAEFFAWYLTVGSVQWDGREFLFYWKDVNDSAVIWCAFAFQAAFYFLYLVDTSFGTISKRFRTTWDDTVRAIIAPMLAFGWIYILFHQNAVLSGYLGIFALIGAVWYALIHQIYVACTSTRQETIPNI